ncbi:DnaB-like helicase N-terminal domain-containing protein (plasmid) [Borreliella yangtzensis]|uniref:Replicative DNA helicase n=1 Tax=Borreliella yangtzensis TaxID=683292 RepID=A0ABR6PB21_9SPIR|nr:replicative DNA helicase [Borreliella yangtzensis]
MKNNFCIKDIIENNNPFNRNSKSVVIGSALNNAVKIEEILPYLKSDDFDFDINKKIFSCVWAIYM